MLSRILTTIAAASLIGGAAMAQTAQPLSLANSPAARASADASGAGSLENRGIGIYVIGAVVLGLIVWGVIELTNNNDKDSPSSP